MIRTPARFSACAVSVLVLTLHLPLAAQEQPGGFSLPEPSPTPTPAPQGPADERARVVSPPRMAPAPRIEPVPVLNPEPAPALAPLALPPPRNAPRTTPNAAASPVPEQAPVTSADPQPAALPSVTANDPIAVPQILPEPRPDAGAPTIAARDDTAPALPTWWLWAAGGLAALAGGLMLWQRRKPKVPRLAPPPPGMENDPSAPDYAVPARTLELALDVTGATRSVMMFTLHYRLTLANRTGHAVSDLSLAVQLACARRGAANAASHGAAQRLEQIDRIGPHQSRSITGEVQLPLSEIAPLRQGNVPLFIPLVHVTLESEGQSALSRSFVIGTPSVSGAGRLHPIPLGSPPGSITDLRAQRIEVPAVSASA